MLEITSPTLPAFALSFVVVPTMPFVLDGVNVPVLLSVVNAPVLAAVLPIGPGDAKRFTNPVPLTVELALSVVNAPVLGVVFPTAVLFSPLDAASVVNAPGEGVTLPTPAVGGLANSVSTNAVVASCVVFVCAAAVGAVGVPLNAGFARGAMPSEACVWKLGSAAAPFDARSWPAVPGAAKPTALEPSPIMTLWAFRAF